MRSQLKQRTYSRNRIKKRYLITLLHTGKLVNYSQKSYRQSCAETDNFGEIYNLPRTGRNISLHIQKYVRFIFTWFRNLYLHIPTCPLRYVDVKYFSFWNVMLEIRILHKLTPLLFQTENVYVDRQMYILCMLSVK